MQGFYFIPIEIAYTHFFKYIPDREIFELSDGGLIALDWFYPESSTFKSAKEKEEYKYHSQRPIVAVVPGLTGDHSKLYMISSIRGAL